MQVVIEGFKSYREETSTEPFSPKVNVVGKSMLLLVMNLAIPVSRVLAGAWLTEGVVTISLSNNHPSLWGLHHTILM
jgi:hypothetical protein